MQPTETLAEKSYESAIFFVFKEDPRPGATFVLKNTDGSEVPVEGFHIGMEISKGWLGKQNDELAQLLFVQLSPMIDHLRSLDRS